jgi:protein-tyrosine-phosphatase/DNA-binding transcriptional ArsR family regulator
MADSTDPESAPPVFLRAAGHPLRWRLLSELVRGDRQVHELTALLAQPQNLISYHLRQLRDAGLVTARRSSADGRDTYYQVNLDHCRDLLAATGGALHPGLRLDPPPPPALPAGRPPVRVLFLCTGNSSRSQLAEAMLRRAAGDRVAAFSAGSHPKPIHPHVVTVLAERGIDLGAARPKHLDEYAGHRFDHVITLCDKVREICPEFPDGPAPAHWSVPDPAAAPDGLSAFTRAAADLDIRIAFLLHRLARTPAETR